MTDYQSSFGLVSWHIAAAAQRSFTIRNMSRRLMLSPVVGVMTKHKHRDLTALGYNADLFQNLIVHG